MWPRENDLKSEPLVVRGPTLTAALRTAEEMLGCPVKALKADRIRRGGIAGFFATDLGVEVTVEPMPSAAAPVGFQSALERLVSEAASGDRAVTRAQASPGPTGLTGLSATTALTAMADVSALTDVVDRVRVAPAVEAAPVVDHRPAVEIEPVVEMEPGVEVEPTVEVVSVAAPTLVARRSAVVQSSAPIAVTLPPPLPAPMLPPPGAMGPWHGQIAAEVAEGMLSALQDHGTVTVSIRMALPDGSQLSAEARASRRNLER